MKILKSIFILILFSISIISCTDEDIEDEFEKNSVEIVQTTTNQNINTQATGEDQQSVDETEKE
jgi:hypothetical protein